jgi:hypothetical protein
MKTRAAILIALALLLGNCQHRTTERVPPGTLETAAEQLETLTSSH